MYYATRKSIIFNTLHCLARECRTKLIELLELFIRVLFVKQNCLKWSCAGPVSSQTLYDHSRARQIKFGGQKKKIGGHLGGFGADMFEAEIDELKEKNRTLC